MCFLGASPTKRMPRLSRSPKVQANKILAFLARPPSSEILGFSPSPLAPKLKFWRFFRASPPPQKSPVREEAMEHSVFNSAKLYHRLLPLVAVHSRKLKANFDFRFFAKNALAFFEVIRYFDQRVTCTITQSRCIQCLALEGKCVVSCSKRKLMRMCASKAVSYW